MKKALWSRWIYLRILGACFLATFLSLWTQIFGLIGPHGIEPAREILARIGQQEPTWLGRILKLPTLLWFNDSTEGLAGLCIIGVAGAILLTMNWIPRLGIALCWSTFLSFVVVAPQFAWYRADFLLLESAFLALFLVPKGVTPGLGGEDPPDRLIWYLYLWLLFRLMWETGASKIFGGDADWREMTALPYFLEISPFPTWVGWLFYQGPDWFHRCMTFFILFVEIACAFLLFFGRRARLFALGNWILLQLGILLSGNFLHFNYHSISLGLLLMGEPSKISTRRWFDRPAQAILTLYFVSTVLLLLAFPFFPAVRFPRPVTRVLNVVQDWHFVNHYTLYPFIDHERRIVVLEGKGEKEEEWKLYKCRWQTQDLRQKPRFFAPFAFRFDREMHRLLEGPNPRSYRENPFIFRLASRLLERSALVNRLFLETPENPPHQIRAVIYRYRFTDFKTLIASGQWWTREREGFYGPTIERDPSTGAIDYVDSKEYR